MGCTKPYLQFSRIRLSDHLHLKACECAHRKHGPECCTGPTPDRVEPSASSGIQTLLCVAASAGTAYPLFQEKALPRNDLANRSVAFAASG